MGGGGRVRGRSSPKELRRVVLLPSQAVSGLGWGDKGAGKEGLDREGRQFNTPDRDTNTAKPNRD